MSARRQSRRDLGKDPEENEPPQGASNKEMRRLLSRGGVKGRIDLAHADWNFLQNHQKEQIV